MPCRFEVEALCSTPQSLRKKQPCYALQGPDASTELQMIAALKSLSPDSLPLLPSLLGPPCRSAWPHAMIHPQLSQPATDSAPNKSAFQSADSAAASRSALARHPQSLACRPSSTQTDERLEHEEDSMQSSLPTQPRDCPAQLVSPSQAARDDDTAFRDPNMRQTATQSSEGDASQSPLPEADSGDAGSIIERFSLNAEQAGALRAMEAWAVAGASQVLSQHPHTAPSSRRGSRPFRAAPLRFSGSGATLQASRPLEDGSSWAYQERVREEATAVQSACPLCVVHGPFGTGKSMLLVAAIHFFLGQAARDGPLRGCRVAVAAHTNAAVDRVMCGLLQSGVTGMAPCLREPEERLLGSTEYTMHRRWSATKHTSVQA